MAITSVAGAEKPAIILERDRFLLTNVAGDGNCLLHCFGSEPYQSLHAGVKVRKDIVEMMEFER